MLIHIQIVMTAWTDNAIQLSFVCYLLVFLLFNTPLVRFFFSSCVQIYEDREIEHTLISLNGSIAFLFINWIHSPSSRVHFHGRKEINRASREHYKIIAVIQYFYALTLIIWLFVCNIQHLQIQLSSQFVR